MAKGTIKDKVHDLQVRADQLQYTRDRLLNETQIGAQLDVSPMLIFAPFRAASFPRGGFWGGLLRGVGVLLLQWFHHDRVGGAAFDTNERDTQKTQSRDDFPIQGGKKPIQPI